MGPAPLEGAVTVSPAGDPCLSPGAVADAAAAWLGDRQVDPRLAVQVEAGVDSVGFRLLRDDEVRVARTLSPAPAACADRRAALGLSIAMALDATVLGSLRPPEPEPEPEPEVEPEPKPEPELDKASPEVAPRLVPSEPVAEPDPTPQAPLRVSVAASGIGAYGMTPSTAFGGELDVELGVASWLDVVVGTEAVGGLPVALAGGRVATVIGAARLAACPAREFGRVRARICVGSAGGALIASGREFTDSRDTTLPWVAFESGGELDIRLGARLALRLGARAVAPLVRHELDVRDGSDTVVEVRATAPLGVMGTLGVVFRLVGWER